MEKVEGGAMKKLVPEKSYRKINVVPEGWGRAAKLRSIRIFEVVQES